MLLNNNLNHTYNLLTSFIGFTFMIKEPRLSVRLTTSQRQNCLTTVLQLSLDVLSKVILTEGKYLILILLILLLLLFKIEFFLIGMISMIYNYILIFGQIQSPVIFFLTTINITKISVGRFQQIHFQVFFIVT